MALFILTVPLAAARPNVIFIMADDLGYGDLGCYGQKVIRTPNIDRLAEEGTRFTQFYAGSTVCAPSRCCLMTGLHTGHARVRGNKTVPLATEDVTVSEVFKKAGYTTGIIGKWGVGEPGSTGVPNRQGFDYWFGYLNQHHAHDYYTDYLWRDETKVLLPGNADGKRETYTHDLFTAEALSFLDEHKAKPFFLYLPYTVPHANNELGRDTGDGMEVPEYGRFADMDWPTPHKGHAAMIERLDRDIGAIMAKLKALDIDENTLVLFTSDNGPHKEGGATVEFFDSNGELRGLKRDLYEGGIRVPMIVRWLNKTPAGETSDHVWAMWDFLPTMAELIDVEPPADLDGRSMLATMKGKPCQQSEFLYWEFHEGGFFQAVRMGQWKAVVPFRKSLELYDLTRDIAEEHNVAEQHPGIVKQIETYLATARTESEHWERRE